MIFKDLLEKNSFLGFDACFRGLQITSCLVALMAKTGETEKAWGPVHWQAGGKDPTCGCAFKEGEDPYL